LEKTLEEDISIWHKPGHFYFALTRIWHEFGARAGRRAPPELDRVNGRVVLIWNDPSTTSTCFLFSSSRS